MPQSTTFIASTRLAMDTIRWLMRVKKMICKACGMEKDIEFNGYCKECLDIKEQIDLEKLAAGESLQPEETD